MLHNVNYPPLVPSFMPVQSSAESQTTHYSRRTTALYQVSAFLQSVQASRSLRPPASRYIYPQSHLPSCDIPHAAQAPTAPQKHRHTHSPAYAENAVCSSTTGHTLPLAVQNLRRYPPEFAASTMKTHQQ